MEESANVKRKKKKHLCFTCGSSFTKPSDLIRHERIHTGEKPFKCSVCDASFSQSSSLKIHFRKHTGERPFKCQFCGATFGHSHRLKSHCVKFHVNNQLSSRLDTDRHTSSDENSYEINCTNDSVNQRNDHDNIDNIGRSESQNFNTEQNEQMLKIFEPASEQPRNSETAFHGLMNEDGTPLPIENNSSTQDVIETNFKSNPNHDCDCLMCHICGLFHNDVESLETHLNAHQTDKSFQCIFCLQSFTSPSHLKEHLSLHSLNVPYSCQSCNSCSAFYRNFKCQVQIHSRGNSVFVLQEAAINKGLRLATAQTEHAGYFNQPSGWSRDNMDLFNHSLSSTFDEGWLDGKTNLDSNQKDLQEISLPSPSISFDSFPTFQDHYLSETENMASVLGSSKDVMENIAGQLSVLESSGNGNQKNQILKNALSWTTDKNFSENPLESPLFDLSLLNSQKSEQNNWKNTFTDKIDSSLHVSHAFKVQCNFSPKSFDMSQTATSLESSTPFSMDKVNESISPSFFLDPLMSPDFLSVLEGNFGMSENRWTASMMANLRDISSDSSGKIELAAPTSEIREGLPLNAPRLDFNLSSDKVPGQNSNVFSSIPQIEDGLLNNVMNTSSILPSYSNGQLVDQQPIYLPSSKTLHDKEDINNSYSQLSMTITASKDNSWKYNNNDTHDALNTPIPDNSLQLGRSPNELRVNDKGSVYVDSIGLSSEVTNESPFQSLGDSGLVRKEGDLVTDDLSVYGTNHQASEGQGSSTLGVKELMASLERSLSVQEGIDTTTNKGNHQSPVMPTREQIDEDAGSSTSTAVMEDMSESPNITGSSVMEKEKNIMFETKALEDNLRAVHEGESPEKSMNPGTEEKEANTKCVNCPLGLLDDSVISVLCEDECFGDKVERDLQSNREDLQMIDANVMEGEQSSLNGQTGHILKQAKTTSRRIYSPIGEPELNTEKNKNSNLSHLKENNEADREKISKIVEKSLCHERNQPSSDENSGEESSQRKLGRKVLSTISQTDESQSLNESQPEISIPSMSPARSSLGQFGSSNTEARNLSVDDMSLTRVNSSATESQKDEHSLSADFREQNRTMMLSSNIMPLNSTSRNRKRGNPFAHTPTKEQAYDKVNASSHTGNKNQNQTIRKIRTKKIQTPRGVIQRLAISEIHSRSTHQESNFTKRNKSFHQHNSHTQEKPQRRGQSFHQHNSHTQEKPQRCGQCQCNNVNCGGSFREQCHEQMQSSQHHQRYRFRSSQHHPQNHSPQKRSQSCQICHVSYVFCSTFQKNLQTNVDHVNTSIKILKITTTETEESSECDLLGTQSSCSSHNTEFSENHDSNRQGRDKLDEINVHLCHLCGESLSSLRLLNSHIKSHSHSLKRYECNFCSAKFKKNSNLSKHLLIHNGDRPFKCEVCSKSFTQMTNLQVHRRVHTGERPYSCDECQATFAHSQALKVHMRFHSKETRYICQTCGKGFVVKAALEKHLRSHTGEKPYVCKICKTRLSSSSSLSRHAKKHKSGDSSLPFTCDICSAQFAQSGHLKLHLKSHSSIS